MESFGFKLVGHGGPPWTGVEGAGGLHGEEGGLLLLDDPVQYTTHQHQHRQPP